MSILKRLKERFDEADRIVIIGCNQFPGFYESIFDNGDTFYDEETEVKEALENKIGKKKIDVACDYYDYDKYKTDISEAFMNIYVDKIKEVLPIKITENEHFKFDAIDDITVLSPKYYNYTTDKWYNSVITNIKTLQMIKDYTLNLPGAQQYLIDKYSPRDGYIPFLSNNINYWKELDIKEYGKEGDYKKEGMIIGLLDMLLKLSEDENENIFFEISRDVAEDISPICYMDEPTIYYKGVELQQVIKDIKEILKYQRGE